MNKIQKSAELLRKIEKHTDSDDSFACGECSHGTEFLAVSDVPATIRHRDYTYQSAQSMAVRGLTDEEAIEAFELAGVDDNR